MRLIDRCSRTGIGNDCIVIDLGTDLGFKIPKAKLSVGEAAALCLDPETSDDMKDILQKLMNLRERYIKSKGKDDPHVIVNGKEVSIMTRLDKDSKIELK